MDEVMFVMRWLTRCELAHGHDLGRCKHITKCMYGIKCGSNEELGG